MKTFSQVFATLQQHNWHYLNGCYFGGVSNASFTRKNQIIRIAKSDDETRVYIDIKTIK